MSASDRPEGPRPPAAMRGWPPVAPPTPFAFPAARAARLASGLQVVVVERRGLPLVHLQLLIRSGTAADPGPLRGLAYLTAAMVDEGAGDRSALQIAADLQALGTGLSITVDGDATFLTLEVLRAKLDPALAILADVVLRPRLRARDLDRSVDEVRSRAISLRSEPGVVASRCLSAAVFGQHPYGRPVIPLVAEVERLRGARRAVVDFHRRHYRPANAAVVVAGDITLEEVQELVGRHLGRWRGGAPRRRSVPRPGLPERRRLLIVDRPGAPESVLRVGHLGPDRRTRHGPALQVLNMILGGSFTSRLNQNLRETHGFTYGASSSVHLMRHGGLVSVGASVATDVTEAALRETLHELEQIRRRVSAAELDKARRLVLEDVVEAAETVAGLVENYGQLVTYGLSLGRVRRLPDRLEALSVVDILERARRDLHPSRACLVVVGDARRLLGALERTFGPATPCDQDGRPRPP